ncbi:M20/M25/M40 family metallo-hydrolase [Comamonas sp. JC664]|uniref:M20/M25/M40 family metallo-hydrolase n=1 Tax=Comamonas sp. JC664 TaxID=2801917 RepID=UPI00191FE2D2|nr:M20/M25/M40 family metallo-hydrolase [Comamonas sp. JC664]MBL0696869.1 M20/M25/M40 family metallo-hydrolase [Comamonas sp. JC664]GHG81210.1 aminopeptidase [Comamonas sp. KCTC 72670]
MRMKTWMPVAVLLLNAPLAFAEPLKAKPNDKTVWIAIGTDAIAPMQETFAAEGWSVPTALKQQEHAGVFQLKESQLSRLALLMHEKFDRCAGFITYESRDEALASLEPLPPAKNQKAVSYTLTNAATVNTLMGALSADNIRTTIAELSAFPTRSQTSQGGVDAAALILNKWQGYATSAGRTDVTVAYYPHSGWRQPSVILTIRGTTLPNEVVVVGGHLDSISSTSAAPGADDDASGIATFTEVIRAAMANNYRPQRTVKFMAYAAEETGLRGSREIALSHKNQGINVVGVMQLDMTNYKHPNATADVGIVTDNTNAPQNQFIRDLITTYVGVPFTNTSCGYGCSDHASWHAQGYAASIPFEGTVAQKNPNIHTSRDTLTQSNNTATHALKFSKIAAAYVAELAKGTAQ